MLNSIFQSALQGVQGGMQRIDSAASRISQATGQPGQLDAAAMGEHLSELRASRMEVEAAVSVARTADELLGSVIDLSI